MTERLPSNEEIAALAEALLAQCDGAGFPLALTALAEATGVLIARRSRMTAQVRYVQSKSKRPAWERQ